ncbi:MAG: TonB-dependent receptor [Candidatus Latescibacterota bacterium]|jgi:hypothetical protein|nr:MAG: TonB-dependent receptor [Candidatus Latescibacterota bacterium]
MKRAIATLLLLLATAAGTPRPAGGTALRGVVIDAVSGQRISAATVFIVGTGLGGTTDLAGNFQVLFVPPGTYDVRVSCDGYETTLERGIVVGERGIVEIEVALQVTSLQEYRIDDLVVSADRILTTEAAVLAERQLAATIGDAISVEMIARSPDATSSDVLKRITGLSMVDDKFVFVRGVTDRYNATSLDGVVVTSADTDSDKKSFTFDIIPSNLIAATSVVKTATPDLPGDFSGGLVQIRTLEFPPHLLLKASASSSFDENTSSKGFYSSQGGGRDWLGYDDGARALPSGNLTGNDLARALPNSWTLRERRAPLNGSYSFTAGNNHLVGSTEFGYIAALMYKSKFQAVDFTERPTYRGFPLYSFEGSRYERSVLWSGLLNLNLRFAAAHKLGIRSNYVQSGEERVSVSGGMPVSGEYTERQTITWGERTLRLTQVSGDHTFASLWNVEIGWRAYGSDSRAEEPDRRHVEFEEGVWRTFKDNYRTWSTLDESSRGAGVDVTIHLGPATAKLGWLGERKERGFEAAAYSTDPSSVRAPNYELLVLPIESVFAPEHYGQKMFTFVPVTVFTGEYGASQRLRAWYAMIDEPFGLGRLRARITGGARIERSGQEVNTVAAIDDSTPFTARVDETDVLPSAALTLNPVPSVNVRFAYGRSVNRPEFREMANVLYYDLDKTQNVLGNPGLRRASIRNYDVRLEAFPGVGEVLAVSYFYKTLEDAIEERLLPAPERYTRSWFNSPNGHNRGWELEVRKSLGFLLRPLERVSIAGNYTRVHSSIMYVDARTNEAGEQIRTDAERIMQGQAPWTANASILFAEPSWGTSVNVLYNKVGRRLDAVGDTRDEDVYEEPRGLVDVAVNQRIGRRFETKFSVKNLSAKDVVFTSGPLRERHATISRGSEYSLSLSFKF